MGVKNFVHRKRSIDEFEVHNRVSTFVFLNIADSRNGIKVVGLAGKFYAVAYFGFERAVK